MTPVMARSDANIQRYIPALLTLRTHPSPKQAVSQIKFQKANEGFVLAFIPTDDPSKPALAVVGARTMNFLYCDKTIYTHDLSTLPAAREKDYGDTGRPCG